MSTAASSQNRVRFSLTNNNTNGSASASDSESGVDAILQGRTRITRSSGEGRNRAGEESRGAPGSRRYRRYLNSVLSDYESENDNLSEYDSDEDRPIIHFEWHSHFLSCPEFFDEHTNSAKHIKPRLRHRQSKMSNPVDRALERAIRRKKRMEKHAVGTPDDNNKNKQQHHHGHAHHTRYEDQEHEKEAEEQDDDDDDDHQPTLYERKASEDDYVFIASAASSTSSPSSSSSSSSSPSLSLSSSSSLIDPSASLTSTELSNILFSSLNKRLRQLFVDMHDSSFLSELELLFVPYKQGVISEKQAKKMKFHTFSVHDRSEKEGLKDRDDGLALILPDSFHRFLAHGVVQFHQLVSHTTTTTTTTTTTHGDGMEIFVVRRPRSTARQFVPHSATLLKHLETLHASRQ